MTASFKPSRPYPELRCSICLDPLEKNVVNHGGDGEMHPFHRKCILKWIPKQKTCPLCRIAVDPEPITTLEDKFVLSSKKIMRLSAPFIVGLGAGTLLGFAILTMSLGKNAEDRYRLLRQINVTKSLANLFISSISGFILGLGANYSFDEIGGQEKKYVVGISTGWGTIVTSLFLDSSTSLKFYTAR